MQKKAKTKNKKAVPVKKTVAKKRVEKKTVAKRRTSPLSKANAISKRIDDLESLLINAPAPAKNKIKIQINKLHDQLDAILLKNNNFVTQY